MLSHNICGSRRQYLTSFFHVALCKFLEPHRIVFPFWLVTHVEEFVSLHNSYLKRSESETAKVSLPNLIIDTGYTNKLRAVLNCQMHHQFELPSTVKDILEIFSKDWCRLATLPLGIVGFQFPFWLVCIGNNVTVGIWTGIDACRDQCISSHWAQLLPPS